MTTTGSAGRVVRDRPGRAWLAGVIALAACAHRPAAAPRALTATTTAPTASVDLRDVTLSVDAVGDRRVDVAALRGKAVVVATLSINDLGGHALARNLERLAAAHPDDLVVLLLATDGYDAPTLRTAMEVFADVIGIRHAAVAALPAEVRAGSTPFGEMTLEPSVYLVNRAGRMARRLDGYQGLSALQALVAPALPPGH